MNNLKIIIYAITELGFSAGIIECLEKDIVLGWFLLSAFLVLFNGAILSVAEDKNNIIYR